MAGVRAWLHKLRRPRRLPGRQSCLPPPARGEHAPPFIDPPGYARHWPETTLLYRLVEPR
jgi:hypothetical protein